jgi:hypothetical protein
MRRLLVGVALVLFLSTSSAFAELCRWDTPDCVQIRPTLVNVEKTKQNVQRLLQQGGQPGIVYGKGMDSVQSLLDGSQGIDGLGSWIYNDSRPGGQIQQIDWCERIQFVLWNIDPKKRGSNRIATYSASKPGEVAPAVRGKLADVLIGDKAPDETFYVEGCPGKNGSEAGLNLPRDYFDLTGVPDNQVIVLICPDGQSVYPDRAKERGLGITAGQWKRLVRGPIIHVPVLYPGKKVTSLDVREVPQGTDLTPTFIFELK